MLERKELTMFEIICPNCKKPREVKSKQPWMKELPYVKICRVCCQLGKPKTVETRLKLSISMRELQTPEVLERKSQFMKTHPEIWSKNLVAGEGAGWNKGLELPARSEETKEKISNTMKENNK